MGGVKHAPRSQNFRTLQYDRIPRQIETEFKNTLARLSGACPVWFESLKKTKGRKFSDALPLRGQSHKNNFLTETLI